MPSRIEPVYVPLLNPNETEALVVSLHAAEGQAVKAGDILADLETTKSMAELAAEADGYVVGLRFRPGDTARAGDIFCYLAASPAEPVPAVENPPAGETLAQLPAGLRITQPALALARARGIDLSRLPAGPLITEGMLAGLPGCEETAPAAPIDPSAILIYGGGGHGKTLVDLVRSLGGYRLVAIIDDGLPTGSAVLDVPVRGGVSTLASLYQEGVRLGINAVGGIGRIEARLKVFERLAQAGFSCPALVHPRAFIESSASLAAGVQVFAQAYVGSDSRVGFGCIVNTGAIISHDCRLGDYVNISPGAILAGAVQIGERSLVGMGATINLEVKVGPGARIGNGATVKTDVPAGAVVRAGTIWPAEGVWLATWLLDAES